MKCKLCGNGNVKIIYFGKFRDGTFGNLTKNDHELYQCQVCGAIWHDNFCSDLKEFYESKEYREKVDGKTDIRHFYCLHDREWNEQMELVKNINVRGLTVADVGCAGGIFLDHLKGMADEVVAIEPSRYFRTELEKKGYKTYAYAAEANQYYGQQCDYVFSWDVIEHVENPVKFVEDIYQLMKVGGTAMIGTPTDSPIMRELLGESFESFIYSTQHIWYFNKQSLLYLAQNIGARQVEIAFFQRYGLSNCLRWLNYKCPGGTEGYGFVSEMMDICWKKELERQQLADYIVLSFKK